MRNNKRLILTILLITLFINGCSKNNSIKAKNHNVKNKFTNIKNPYKISKQEKINAIVSYYINKSLEIKKPIYPNKPTKKPRVKPAKTLTKGKFETTAQFSARIKRTTKNREKYISRLENDYKKGILDYNKRVKKLTDNYNYKIKQTRKNIGKTTLKALKIYYDTIYGNTILRSIDYDADNGIYYGKLVSSKNNFTKKVAIKMSPSEAKTFYNARKHPKVIYEYKNDSIYLKNIDVKYKNIKYTAMISDNDYKSNEVKAVVASRKINLKSDDFLDAQFIDSDFKVSKKDYALSKINYSKSKVARLSVKDLNKLNKQRLSRLNDDIESLEGLLNKAKKVKKNPKSYAVVFGIEDYLLEADVSYSQNSALMFMQYANKTLGVPDDNMWAFVGDRKTTSGFIKSQWKAFLSLVESGGTVYFYYSGHGVPDNKGNAFILPSDTDAETIYEDKIFMLKNIYSSLSKTKAKKVVAFVDSCFSGKDDKGKLLFDGVAPVLKIKKTTFDKKKMTIFTAGGSKNFSNQYKEKKHRLFSYFLMKGLANGEKDISKLFSYVKRNVANKSRKLGASYIQIPELLGNNRGYVY